MRPFSRPCNYARAELQQQLLAGLDGSWDRNLNYEEAFGELAAAATCILSSTFPGWNSPLPRSSAACGLFPLGLIIMCGAIAPSLVRPQA